MTAPSAPMSSAPASTVAVAAAASNSSPGTGASGDVTGPADRRPVGASGAHVDPGGAANGPPGSATGPPAFASVLEDQVARTALAEGQKETGGSPAPRRSTLASPRAGAGSDMTGAMTPTAGNDLASVIASLSTVVRQLLGSAPPSGPAGTGSPTAGAASTSSTAAASTTAGTGRGQSALAQTAGGLASDTPEAATRAGATVTATPATGAAAQPGQSTTLPGALAATSDSPSQSAGAASPAHSATAQVPPQPTAAPSPPTQPGGPAGAGPASLASSADPSSSRLSPSSATAPGGGATTASDTSSAASSGSVTAAPASPQPAAPPLAPPSPVSASANAAPASGEPHAAGVSLHHAIETVQMTIELGARGGYSQARIQLAPAELGEIRINLHQTADGLVARVTAADGAAAQTLQQGGAELRRSLESAGVTLLRLDIGSGGQQGASADQSGFAGGASGGSPRGNRVADEDSTSSTGASQDATATSVALPNGATIDVLA